MKLVILATAVLIVGAAITSCRKEIPAVCASDCVSINIKGFVVNRSDNIGLGNITITAEWRWNGMCIGCTVYNIGAGRTKADGSFNIQANIDTSMFKKYHLSLRTPADSNYFINFNENNGNYFDKRFDSMDATALQNVSFNLYKKVPLNIRLNRTQSDNFTQYIVFASFRSDITMSSYYFDYSPGDTLIQIKTTPGIFTKIYQRKNFPDYTYTEKTDSLICTDGGNNTIGISY